MANVLMRKLHPSGSGMSVATIDERSVPKFERLGWSKVWTDPPVKAVEEPALTETVKKGR